MGNELELITREAFLDGVVGLLRKQYNAQVKATTKGDVKTADFVISTGAKDRSNDTIKVSGWDFTHYRKNPVVLWAHDTTQLPIAKSTKITKYRQAVNSTAEFATDLGEDIKYDLAILTHAMLEKGFLNAVSVGFKPLKWEFNDESGIDYSSQELYEYSVVPVPDNPEALQMAKGAGIDIAPYYEWAESILDHSDDLIVVKMSGLDRDVIEAVRKTADPQQKLSIFIDKSFEQLEKSISSFETSVAKATARIDMLASEYEEIVPCEHIKQKETGPDTTELVESILKKMVQDRTRKE